MAPQSGTGTPTGTVSLISNLSSDNAGIGSFTLSNGTATGTTTALPGGTYNVTAHYAGDGTFGASDSSPISVTVNKENSSVHLGLITFDTSGHVISSNATSAVYGSPYILQVGVTGTACSSNSRGQQGCPTGAVVLTDNGSPLDAGTYPLNSAGSALDQSIQLPGGSHVVQASYAGDESFNAGVGNATITITRASTQISAPIFQGPQVAGVWTTLAAMLTTEASSGSPIGNVTFFSNGIALTGTYSYSPVYGTNGAQTGLNVLMRMVFDTAGTKVLTATYNGDDNFAASSSASNAVNIKFLAPIFSSITANPSAVSPGQGITVTTLLDARNTTIMLTGTISFVDRMTGATIPGDVVYTPTTEQDTGNLALQASLTFQPSAPTWVFARYSGDMNFPSADSYYAVNVSITGTDFMLYTPQPSTVVISSPGNSAGFLLGIGTQTDFSSTINFSASSCSGMPAESSCSFTPASLQWTGSSQVTVSTTGPHQVARSGGVHETKSPPWTATLGLVIAAMLFSGFSKRRCRWNRLLPLSLIAILLTLSSCGGGSSFSGGGEGR